MYFIWLTQIRHQLQGQPPHIQDFIFKVKSKRLLVFLIFLGTKTFQIFGAKYFKDHRS